MSTLGRLRVDRDVVPRSRGRRETVYPRIILGAGCAGLSLAINLLERGVREPILVVDRRDRFENDRTWCFWDTEPTPFSDLASHTWSRWMVHDGRRETVASCSEYRYLRVRSADFYRRAIDRLTTAPNVTLALGRPILDVRETQQRVTIATSGGNFHGLQVFDGLGRTGSKPLAAAQATRGGPTLLQHFFGQTIRVDRPVFDPSCPTLMDFRAAQADGPHFVYVLPLSTTEALVENTYLFPCHVPPERHRHEIATYLRLRYDLTGGSYHVLEEEAGAIPMTMGAGTPATRRITPIGLAGGAARPSSGYTFLRIQRQARWLAERLAAGEEPDPAELRRALGPPKYRFFDAIFLQTLADQPDLAPKIFGRMFARTDPASLVRFLSERSKIGDDLRIVAALPKIPFMTAAVRSVPAWLSRRSPSTGI